MPKTISQVIKNEKQTIKKRTNKNWKTTSNNVLFVCEDYTQNFRPE